MKTQKLCFCGAQFEQWWWDTYTAG